MIKIRTFLKIKSKDGQIYLKQGEVARYKYMSFMGPSGSFFDVEVILNFEDSNRELMDYIQKWSYQRHDHEDFYREVSFGVIINRKIVKKIVFNDAYVLRVNEQHEYFIKTIFLYLDIRQKEDRSKGVTIFPEIIQKRVEPEPIVIPKIEDDFLIGATAAPIYPQNLESSNVKLFKKKLSKQKQITKNQIQILTNRFGYGTKIAQNLFLKYVPDNSIKFQENRNAKTQCSENERRVQMNSTQNLSEHDKLESDYFHEHGHLLDFREGELDEKGNIIGIYSSNKKFDKLLKEDFRDYVTKYMRENNVTKSVAYERISKKLDNYEYNNISDLYGAMSDNLCAGKYHHPTQYWKEDRLRLSKEAFANFFEAQFDPRKIEMLEEFFPKSSRKFDTLLSEEFFLSDNAKLFKKKLLKQDHITEEYSQILINRFEDATEVAQVLFLEHVPDNSIKFDSSEMQETVYLVDEKRVQMSIVQDASDRQKVSTEYFHEHGHLLDFKEVRRDENTILIGKYSHDEKFGNLLREDFEDYIVRYMKKNNTNRSTTYKQISEKLNYSQQNNISDLYGAMSNNMCVGQHQTPTSYWRENKFRIPKEAFAHFFEAQFDPKKLQTIKEFFPKSSKRFDRLLEKEYQQVKKNIKKNKYI